MQLMQGPGKIVLTTQDAAPNSHLLCQTQKQLTVDYSPDFFYRLESQVGCK